MTAPRWSPLDAKCKRWAVMADGVLQVGASLLAWAKLPLVAWENILLPLVAVGSVVAWWPHCAFPKSPYSGLPLLVSKALMILYTSIAVLAACGNHLPSLCSFTGIYLLLTTFISLLALWEVGSNLEWERFCCDRCIAADDAEAADSPAGPLKAAQPPPPAAHPDKVSRYTSIS